MDTNYRRPTLGELVAANEADFSSRLPGADSRLRRSVLSVLARVLAGSTHLLYGFIDFIARQLFPDTATGDFLKRWATIWGVVERPETKAQGLVTLTGVNGSIVGEGKVLQRGDGVEYETTQAVTISGGTATVSVRCRQAGSVGNTPAGTALTFVSPVSGVNAQATSEELTGGANREDIESLRERLIRRMQRPPHGGSKDDYETWAKEVPGVTRAWCYPQEDGISTVRVRFMMDGTYENGIPQAGDVDTVKAYIEDLRPVTAELFVSAPVAVPLDLEIELLDENDEPVTDPTVRAAIQAELEDLLLRLAAPRADGVVNGKPDGKIRLSHIRQAISNSAGEYHHNLISPDADVQPENPGEIFVMGAITWTEPES